MNTNVVVFQHILSWSNFDLIIKCTESFLSKINQSSFMLGVRLYAAGRNDLENTRHLVKRKTSIKEQFKNIRNDETSNNKRKTQRRIASEIFYLLSHWSWLYLLLITQLSNFYSNWRTSQVKQNSCKTPVFFFYSKAVWKGFFFFKIPLQLPFTILSSALAASC